MADGEVYDTILTNPIGIQHINKSPSYFVEQLAKAGEMDDA